MGASDAEGRSDAYRKEYKSGWFWMYVTEVSNAKSAELVNATNYINTLLN